MFCALLKAKLDIEAKVINLQKNYLEILSSPVREIEFSNENNAEKAKNLLEVKIETLHEIVGEYKAALRLHHQISAEIVEARETAEELSDHLDNLFEALGIEIPEDLKSRPQPEQLTEIVQRLAIQPSSDDEEEDKENSQIVYQNSEQEEEISDKENNSSSSGDYFSPNIQIKKSFVDSTATNDILYTPAVKSSSKLPLIKRQFSGNVGN